MRFLGASCNSGQWIFGSSLFLCLALGFFRSDGTLGVQLGFWISFSGLLWATGHRDGEAGSFCQGTAAFGIWGLGLLLFLIASVYCACIRQWQGFPFLGLGAVAPLGGSAFLSLRIMAQGHFGSRIWGLAVLGWGFGVVPEHMGSDAWSWRSGDFGVSC